jgi:hypothetical protein
VIAGVGKVICKRNGVGGPDDFPHLEVPPHIQVVKARPNGKHGKHGKQTCQHDGKRETPV